MRLQAVGRINATAIGVLLLIDGNMRLLFCCFARSDSWFADDMLLSPIV